MGLEAESSSFRDRSSQVFRNDRRILRALDERSADFYRQLAQTRFFQKGQQDGSIVATETADDAISRQILSASPDRQWCLALEHETIPFVSYPYEWSFSMLREAALLHLRLLREALSEGWILKDSSAYNIQWLGTRPVFIDVPSFEPYRDGDPWIGYTQFCELFLYPLMLEAYRAIPLQRLLRARVDGVEPGVCNRLLGLRDRLRPGVFSHVYLQSRLQESLAARPDGMRRTVERAGFGKQLIESNVDRLLRLVARLAPRRAPSAWTSYSETCTYEQADRDAKHHFVSRAAEAIAPGMIWDLGCNDATFTRVAAKHGDYAVAVDFDPAVVDRVFAELRQAPTESTRVLPLTMDLADPSPAQGWRSRERVPFEQRGRADLLLALALIHHLVLTRNLPLAQVIEWLTSQTDALVLEFVDKSDPMARRLLANKDDQDPDYTLERCRSLLEEHFEISHEEPLASGTRHLFLARRRGVS